jgi:chaperonin GroEL
VVEACVAAGARNLFIIVPEVRDSAVGLLVLNRARGVIEGAIAVNAPSIGTQRMRILEDIAVLCGGRFVSRERGCRLADVTIDDLGTARQAWATRSAFGILGARGEWASRKLRLLRAHGLIYKLTGTHRYHFTKASRIATIAIVIALRSSVRQLTAAAA